jgi:hypothetical protein
LSSGFLHAAGWPKTFAKEMTSDSPITFQIESFIGALPLRFGKSQDEVVNAIGAPRTNSTNYLGGATFNYYSPGLDLNVGFDKDTGFATHFGFGRLSSVRFGQLDVFGDPTCWKSIVGMSSDCHEWVGFIICCDLGIQLSGFHDDDESQLAISMFPEGDYERHRAKFKPFSLS